MENRVLLRASIGSLVLLLSILIIGFILGEPLKAPDFASAALNPAIEKTVSPQPEVETIQTQVIDGKLLAMANYLGNCDIGVLEQLEGNFVAVSKAYFEEGVSADFEPSYVDRLISLSFSGEIQESNNAWTPMIVRVKNDKVYDSELATRAEFDDLVEARDKEQEQEKKNASTDVETKKYEDTLQTVVDRYFEGDDPVICAEESNNDGRSTLTMTVRRATEYKLYEDDFYFYIKLIDPRDIYERIVVIDAGHGGKDPGATAENDKYLEKDINLGIVRFLNDMLETDQGIKVFATRTTDRKLSLMQRVRLAEDLDADMFISVHCNAAKSSQVGGTEVLYNQYWAENEKLNSKLFAEFCLEKVNKRYPLMNRGIVPRGEDVLVLSECSCPAALVEAAYLSNDSNRRSIIKEENQIQVALGIYDAILEAYEVIEGPENPESLENPDN